MSKKIVPRPPDSRYFLSSQIPDLLGLYSLIADADSPPPPPPWMVHWEDRRTFETGSNTGREKMYSVARLSRMPVFPDTGCLKYFGNLGRECVLDFNAGETYTPVWSPECGLEMVPPKPPFRVEVV